MSYTSTLVLLLHLIYLSYLFNVYHACSFFTNLDLFCIDNAHIIYRKIRYIPVMESQTVATVMASFLYQSAIRYCDKVLWSQQKCSV